MIVTFYLFKNQLETQKKLIHCLFCKRPLMKINSDEMTISNLSSKDLPPGVHYIEHKCHSCLALYRILFQ